MFCYLNYTYGCFILRIKFHMILLINVNRFVIWHLNVKWFYLKINQTHILSCFWSVNLIVDDLVLCFIFLNCEKCVFVSFKSLLYKTYCRTKLNLFKVAHKNDFFKFENHKSTNLSNVIRTVETVCQNLCKTWYDLDNDYWLLFLCVSWKLDQQNSIQRVVPLQLGPTLYL